MIYHLGNFDDLMQNDFLFIPNITFANLYKLIHKVTFMPVSSDTLNLETGKEVKKYKN